MDIKVSARHFTISETERQYAVDQISSRFADLTLTIISASVVMDMQGNRFTAEVVVNAKKDFTAAAQVEDFDWKKALDAAIAKAETQVTKYLEKKQHHKNGETLAGLEAKNAEKNAR